MKHNFAHSARPVGFAMVLLINSFTVSFGLEFEASAICPTLNNPTMSLLDMRPFHLPPLATLTHLWMSGSRRIDTQHAHVSVGERSNPTSRSSDSTETPISSFDAKTHPWLIYCRYLTFFFLFFGVECMFNETLQWILEQSR